MQLDRKVALITGAGSGIGKATALLFAREGAKIAALDREEDEDLRGVIAEIGQQGGEALALAADVSNPEQMRAAIERAAERWGRLDVVLANAGINGVWAPLEDLAPDEWDRTLEINLKGTLLTA